MSIAELFYNNYNDIIVRTITIEGGTSTTSGSLAINGGCSVSGALDVGGSATIDGDCLITGVLTVPNLVYEQVDVITSTNDASDTASGALIVAGGAGIAKTLFATNAQITSTDTSAPALVVAGGVSIGYDTTATKLKLSDGTASNATNEGALQVVGGVGVGGSLIVGGTIDAQTSLQINNGQAITAISTDITMAGDSDNTLSTQKAVKAYVDSSTDGGAKTFTSVKVTDTISSTSVTSGAISVSGGIGVAKNISIGAGGVSLYDMSVGALVGYDPARSQIICDTGALIIQPQSATNEVFINGIVNVENILVNSGIASSGTDTGSLVIDGGVGINKNVNIGGITNISSVIASTNTASGALHVAGGVGIASDVHIGGDLFLGDTSADFKKIRVSNGFSSGNDFTYLSSNTANSALMLNSYLNPAGGNFVIPDNTSTCAGVTLTASNVNMLSSQSGGAQPTLRWQINSLGERLYNNSDPSKYCDMSVDTSGDYHMNASGNDIYFDNTDTIHIQSTEGTTNTNSGSLQVAGGVGVGGALNVGGNTKISSGTTASDTASGALVIAGGAGISGKLYCGQISSTVGGNNVSSIVVDSTATNASSVLTIDNLGTTTTGGPVCQLELLGDSYRSSFIKLGNRSNAQSFLLGRKYTQNNTASITSVSMNRDDGTGTFTEFQRWQSYPSLSNIFYQQLNVSLTTDSTSTSTGALIVSGGLGVGENLHANTIHATLNTGATDVTTGSLICNGGCGIAQSIYVGGAINSTGGIIGNQTNDSGSTNTGALQIIGGGGIGKNLYVGGTLYARNNSTNALGLYVSGGQSVLLGSISSTNVTTGTLVVTGGVGISQNLNVGGDVKISSGTQASDTASGALQVVGGIGVSGGVRALSFGNLDAAQLLTGNNTSFARIGSGAVNLYLYGEAYGGEQRNLVTSGMNSFKLVSTVVSNSTSTGALIITGGGGIGMTGNIYTGAVNSTSLVAVNGANTTTLSTDTNGYATITPSGNQLYLGGTTSLNIPSSIYIGGSTLPLNFYNTYTTTLTFSTGNSTASVNMTIVRLGRHITVQLYQSNIATTANAGFTCANAIPANYIPNYSIDISATVTSNNVIMDGRYIIDSTGAITVYRAYPNTAFQNNSAIGVPSATTGVCFSYIST